MVERKRVRASNSRNVNKGSQIYNKKGSLYADPFSFRSVLRIYIEINFMAVWRFKVISLVLLK
jgi:hypothetical protein